MAGIATEFKFKLSNKIIYHHESVAITANHFLLIAPSLKQSAIASKLKQLVIRGMTSASVKQQAGTEQVASSSMPTGEEVLFVIMSSEIDFSELIETFKQLLCSGVCKLNSKIIMDSIPDEILIDDVESILGEYISKFFLHSLLAKMI